MGKQQQPKKKVIAVTIDTDLADEHLEKPEALIDVVEGIAATGRNVRVLDSDQ